MTDEQRKADLERVSNQNSFADVARIVEEPHGGGLFSRLVTDPLHAVVGSTRQGKAVFDSTDFDAKNLDLNEMIDLVEQTNPEDLESSGKALWDARDAIKAAADELDGRINKVRWVGRAGTAFREWGGSLVTSTQDLSDFAGKAGDQITAAAVGLASVRKAMPARDPNNRKRPESFTDAEKAANKEDYDAAVKVEKDRQEAINQMNRLASYYAVSSQQLQVLQEKPPTFKPMPNVGVPEPERLPGSGPGGSASSGDGAVAGTGHHAQVESSGRAGTYGTGDAPFPSTSAKGTVTYPESPVGTNIDSVGTLPPTTTPATGHTLPVTGTPPTVSGQPGVLENYGPQIPNRASGRTTGGTSGLRTPASAQGRTQPGLTNSVTGRTTGPGGTSQMGRPTETGQPVARGNGSGSKPFPMGQGGVTGGTPRASGTTGPRANVGPATGAGRANGVVGGRPATPGGTAAKGGPRIPRGTVIGAGPTANPRPSTGGPGQRGVFGAPQSGVRPGTGAGGASRGGTTGGSKPVSSSPTGRNSAIHTERNGMTRGGTGLVRGPGNKGKPGDERNAQGTARPDNLVEGEETHLPNKPRRDVPPVVN
ncbi:WXG100 family type VII secretion target [Streptomyces sp. HC307]|uniref:WXG100 family type VII secretion target n=1 Tax=Streptomyces flavusporus TaxID=3385496 RepID=UPI0039175E9F